MWSASLYPQLLKLKAFSDIYRQIRNLFGLILRLHRIFNEAMGRTGETIQGSQQKNFFSQKFRGSQAPKTPLKYATDH